MIFPFNRSKAARLLIALVAMLTGLALLWVPAWQSLEKRGFDVLSVVTAPGTTPLPIILISIDDASLAEIAHPWPWPRSLHAGLIDKLKAAGAAVIAFDILFSLPTRPADDQALAQAITRAGNVVLAAGLVRQETPAGTLWSRQAPLTELQAAGGQVGVVNLAFDSDLVMRRLSTDPDAFWRRILVALRRAMPEQELPGAVSEDAMIRYVGPPGAFPTLPYHKALELEKHVDSKDFEGAVVIVGRSTRSATEIGMAQADLFSTPHTQLTGELMPGLEIHANILDSVIRQRVIRPVAIGLQMALLVTLTLIASTVLLLFQRWFALGAVALLVLAVPASAWALFSAGNWWLPVGAPIVAVLVVVAGHFIKSALVTRRERDRVQKMFALYVPPEFVKTLIAHPERAGLGGDTRHLTVLFCDLRGFSTLSAQMAPADITMVLNRYFTCMTNAIFSHGGTVDKFIGDAVMAFWGAPLPDPEQERHAIQAAIAMKDSLVALNLELAAQGKPQLRLGIGIHSGDALVGNMGAESRLSYTAIGDTVNVASRLEGANKTLGTEIVLSSDTAKGAPDLPLRTLGAIRVKGRPQPLQVLTPCDQTALIEATDAALAAQGLGEMAAACCNWQKVLALAPHDALATLALERLASGGWDGVLDTDK
jgi:adenylate cyclase